MPAQPNSLSARLRQLEAAKARAAKLPKKQRLSFGPMRELLNVTVPVLRGWCNEIDGFEASGCFVRGGNGIEWDFEPRKTIDFLIRHFKSQVAKEQDRVRAIRKAVGGEDDLTEGLGFAEMRQAFELARAIKKERREDGQHCLKSDVEWLFSTAMERCRNRVMSIITKADPNGNLSPSDRAKVENACREVLLEMYEDQVDLKEEFDARVQQKGSA